MIDTTALRIECAVEGTAEVSAWAKCRSPEDIDDVILWLGLAREVMVQWQAIRAARVISTASNVTNLKGKDR